MRTSLLSIFLLFLALQPLMAQSNVCYVDHLKTLQTQVNGKWGELPIMLMGVGQYIDISFDDLQHEYVRYTYSIKHCNADWTSSNLYEGDYMTGINGVSVIDNYEQSMNTEMPYNHYSFRLPNNEHQLLVSGNYRVDIFEDGNEEDPVATACFSILEPKVGIDITITANTDVDTYQTHQQVDFNINYQSYSISNPEAEFIPVVLQNHRWDNHAYNLKPTYLRNHQLVYTHQQSLIFDAGHEYRRFEMLDKYVPTMRVDKMRYEDPYYHAYIYEDLPANNYIFDQDQNGRYIVRNSDDYMNNTESDYFITHFTLKMPQLSNGNVYLFGDMTGNCYTEYNQMIYNETDHQYEIVLPLKQGLYNYQYHFVREGETTGQTAQVEGNFYQTENEYTILIYHRPFGGRYDKLVGYKTLKFQSNQ